MAANLLFIASQTTNHENVYISRRSCCHFARNGSAVVVFKKVEIVGRHKSFGRGADEEIEVEDGELLVYRSEDFWECVCT